MISTIAINLLACVVNIVVWYANGSVINLICGIISGTITAYFIAKRVSA